LVKRILYISNTGKIIGGGEFSLLNLIENLDKKRFEPLVAVPGEGNFTDKLKRARIPYLLISLPTLRSHRIDLMLLSIIQFTKILNKQNIDLVHANGSRAMLIGGLAARFASLPCIWHLRVADKSELIYDKLLYSLATRVVAISSAVVKRLTGRRVKRKIRLIHNGVDLKIFQPENKQYRQDVCSEIGIDPNAPVITTICQLTPRKRVDIFIRAAAIVLKSLPEVKFIICGSGVDGYQHELTNYAKECGVGGKVIFTGFREDPQKILGATDIFVLPSDNEAFGRVLIEAMASEVAVVATRSGGIPDIIEHRENGYLFELGNFAELADRLLKLLKDNSKIKRISQAGRKGVVDHFSIQIHVKRVQALYDEMLA
jgi:glycosyltransferase involved in cell wall biosynthesis